MRHHIRAMERESRRTRNQTLRNIPFVMLTAGGLMPAARAGATRSCPGASLVVLDPATSRELIEIDPQVELVIAVCDTSKEGELLALVEERGGTGIPVLELEDARGATLSKSTIELLGSPELRGLNVPVPSLPEDVRRVLWDQMRAWRVEERHHPVDVDGRPALLELRSRGFPVDERDPRALAAGAAGVLAGRLADRNRAWRRPDR
jgi:hypothetical protein